MKLFESTWQSGWEYYQRYYDTNLKRSVKSKIDLKHEWFEPSSRGLYTSIIDSGIRLDKKQGNSKDGRDQYGLLNPLYRNIRDNYWNKNQYNLNPRIWFLDIETRSGTCSTGFPVPEKALEPISLIQIYDTESKTMFVLGVRDWKHQHFYEFDYEVKYVNCKDEIKLLQTFLALFKKLDPLIIYAWNGMGFDYPYIHNRLKKLGMGVDDLSNYGDVSYKEGEFKGKKEFSFKSDGHFFIDLMQVYKKFVQEPTPSYSLDTIAEIELKQNKVQHTEYVAFDDFYSGKYNIPDNPTDEQKNSKIYQEAIKGNTEEVKELAHSEFVYYGIVDTNLIRLIDEAGNFTSLMNMISEKMGVQLSDALGTVKPWSQYISNKAMLNNQVMPPKKHNDTANVVGGFVRAPEKGKHWWILSEDVNSMYPLLGMVAFNMSPETYIPKHELPPDLRDIVLSYFNTQDEDARFEIPKEIWEKTTSLLIKHNLSLGINGAVFDKSNLGMIPQMVQEIYNDRKIAKGKMFEYEKRTLIIKEILHKRNA